MSSKKGKRKKGTTLNLNDFLQSDVDPSAGKAVSISKKIDSWADMMEDDGAEKVVVLPTAPSSVRGGSHIDPSRIPDNPPYKAFVGNISWDASEGMLRDIFKDLRVVDVHLPVDPGGRLRGYGYVEFETKDDLVEALQMDDLEVCGRKVRVDIKTQSERDQQRGGGFSSFTRDDDRSDGDWRSGPRPMSSAAGPRSYGTAEQQPKYANRPDSKYKQVPSFADFGKERGRDGPRMDDRGPRYEDRGPRYEDRGPRYDDRGPRYEDRGPRYDDRGSRFESRGPRYEDRGPRYDDRGSRYEDRGPRYDDRGPRYEDRGPRYEDRGPRYDDRGPRYEDRASRRDADHSSSDDHSRSAPDARGGHSSSERAPPEKTASSRPKLNLKPRSVPIDTTPSAATQSSIFGGAKPVDTSAKEREIEERLSKVDLTSGSSDKHSDRFGERTSTQRRAEAYRDIRLSEPGSDLNKGNGSHNTARENTNGGVSGKSAVRSAHPRVEDQEPNFAEKSRFSALDEDTGDF